MEEDSDLLLKVNTLPFVGGSPVEDTFGLPLLSCRLVIKTNAIFLSIIHDM